MPTLSLMQQQQQQHSRRSCKCLGLELKRAAPKVAPRFKATRLKSELESRF